MNDTHTIAARRMDWRRAHRLIPTRFPPVGLFDRVADPKDLDAVYAIEALTNDRLRNEVGELALVAPADRVSGPGTTPIMAAFTHCNPEGSRFSDGTYGVYYAANRLETAVREVAHHRARFLARTREPPDEFDFRCYIARIRGTMHDLRGRTDLPELYDPDSYSRSMVFGRAVRALGSPGIVYDSVRDRGGQCVGVFKPRVITDCVQAEHVTLIWDGQAIQGWYVKSELRNV